MEHSCIRYLILAKYLDKNDFKDQEQERPVFWLVTCSRLYLNIFMSMSQYRQLVLTRIVGYCLKLDTNRVSTVIKVNKVKYRFLG